jgi:hypothetical protein
MAAGVTPAGCLRAPRQRAAPSKTDDDGGNPTPNPADAHGKRHAMAGPPQWCMHAARPPRTGPPHPSPSHPRTPHPHTPHHRTPHLRTPHHRTLPADKPRTPAPPAPLTGLTGATRARARVRRDPRLPRSGGGWRRSFQRSRGNVVGNGRRGARAAGRAALRAGRAAGRPRALRRTPVAAAAVSVSQGGYFLEVR